MQFAPLVRAARSRAGLTQGDLAERIGTSIRAVWQIEQGGGTLKTLVRILLVLNIPVAGLPPGRDLGSRLKAARLRRGWSLHKLSMRSALSIPTLRGLEKTIGRVKSFEAAITALVPSAREGKARKLTPAA